MVGTRRSTEKTLTVRCYMYNVFEEPTIRIDLNADDSAVYLNNIQNIIETPFADKVYFYGEYINLNLVNKLAEKFPEKEYYVPIDADFDYKDNVNIYTFIRLCDIKQLKKFPSNLIILNIDISAPIDPTDINYLNNLMVKNSTIIIFQMVSERKIKNLDFRKFVSNLELFDFDFYFDGLVKSLSVIREHPCNAYLCNGHKCHSSKSNFPRYLHVTNKGIFPYSVKINELSMLKEIATQPINFQEYLEQRYKNSPEHLLFIDLNRQLFQDYIVNQIFEYLPWNIFMEKMYYEKY